MLRLPQMSWSCCEHFAFSENVVTCWSRWVWNVTYSISIETKWCFFDQLSSFLLDSNSVRGSTGVTVHQLWQCSHHCCCCCIHGWYLEQLHVSWWLPAFIIESVWRTPAVVASGLGGSWLATKDYTTSAKDTSHQSLSRRTCKFSD